MAWICTVNIKQYFTDNDDPESIQRSAGHMADVLDRAYENADDPLVMLACMGLPKFAKRLRRVRTVDGINRVLSDLYDYGDSARVWFGP